MPEALERDRPAAGQRKDAITPPATGEHQEVSQEDHDALISGRVPAAPRVPPDLMVMSSEPVRRKRKFAMVAAIAVVVSLCFAAVVYAMAS